MASIIICGSRTFAEPRLVNLQVEAIPADITIIVGGARGPDQWAEYRARALGRHVIVVPAQWNVHDGCQCPAGATYCRRAGFRRNWEMINMRPAMVIAFWDGDSAGTSHMIQLARRRGIPVRIVRGRGVSPDVDEAETNARTEAYQMAMWRQDESAEREALHELGMHVVEADDVNPETTVTPASLLPDYDVDDSIRAGWFDAFDMYRRLYAWRARARGVFERDDRRLPDRFSDPEDLINLEDYTCDELAVVDHTCAENPFWSAIIDDIIRTERPLTPNMWDKLVASAERAEQRRRDRIHVSGLPD